MTTKNIKRIWIREQRKRQGAAAVAAAVAAAAAAVAAAAVAAAGAAVAAAGAAVAAVAVEAFICIFLCLFRIQMFEFCLKGCMATAECMRVRRHLIMLLVLRLLLLLL